MEGAHPFGRSLTRARSLPDADAGARRARVRPRYGTDVATPSIPADPTRLRPASAPRRSSVSPQAAWIPAPEVARRVGVSRRTFGRMLARGEIPYKKRGSHQQSRVVVHATTLARLLDADNAV